MRRAWILSMVIAVALPLVADEQKKTAEKSTSATAETKAAQTMTAQNAEPLVPAQPVTAQDSPFVAAAKRANRLGKKPTNVITNETLAQYGRNARITTANTPAANLPPLPPAASPTPEMKAAAKAAEQRKKAEERAAKARKAAEERQQTLATKAAGAEEGLYDLEEEDPAMNEQEASDAASKANERPPEH